MSTTNETRTNVALCPEVYTPSNEYKVFHKEHCERLVSLMEIHHPRRKYRITEALQDHVYRCYATKHTLDIFMAFYFGMI